MRMFLDDEKYIPLKWDGKYTDLERRYFYKEIDIDRFPQTIEKIRFYHEHLDKLPRLALYDLSGEFDDYCIIRSPFIKGKTLKDMLLENIDYRSKIALLKELGLFLGKISKSYPSLGFAFGDVHEENFLFDSQGIIGIDYENLSSDRYPWFSGPYSFYADPEIKKLDKYGYGKYKLITKASSDSDLYCFIIMIINTIAGRNMCGISKKHFFKYLEFLDNLGFDSHLLEAFSSIYSKDHVIDPTPFLDTITISGNRSNYFSQYKR